MKPIQYKKSGDFQIPDFPETKEEPVPELSYFGRRRMKYLKEHDPVKYQIMIEDRTLWNHLKDIDKQAWEYSDRYVAEMMKKNHISEDLKDTDTLAWVGYVNQYKQEAEEIINRDLIYC